MSGFVVFFESGVTPVAFGICAIAGFAVEVLLVPVRVELVLCAECENAHPAQDYRPSDRARFVVGSS